MIGDSFTKNLINISPSVTVQCFGNMLSGELRQQIRADRVNLQYSVIVVVVGGLQLMTHTAEQIIEGIEQLILTLRNRAPKAWILLSTLLYRPSDETLSKTKIDIVNAKLVTLTQQLAGVGCKCVTVKSHLALVSPLDNKLLRPLHVYFEDGLIPSKQAAYLLVPYFVVCALEIHGK